MLRFSMNRWWAFILALCLFTVGLFALHAQSPSACRADDGGGPSFTTPSDPPPAYGDPDVPSGPGAGKTGRGYTVRGALTPTIQTPVDRPTGEGTVTTSALMQRLRLFLLSFRSLYLHF